MTASEILVTQKEKSNELNQVHCHQLVFDSFLHQNIVNTGTSSSLQKVFATQDIILMQFSLNGSYTYINAEEKKIVTLKTAQHNIFYIKKGDVQANLNGKNYHFVNIYVKEDFFLKYLPSQYLVRKTDNITKVFDNNLYINPKIKHILNEIDNCEFNGHLKLLYVKAKIIELLTLQLVQHEEEKLLGKITLKPLEIEKMMLVKEIIEENFTEHHTITSLARAAGTNEQYLKTHFKLLFGDTVFRHILMFKMEKAKEMLLTGKYLVTEIAETVGYKHATHFTNAFKKFFGCLPQSFKSKVLWGGYFTSSLELETIEILSLLPLV